MLFVRNKTQSEEDEMLEIINNWRSSHAFPLNTMQMRLRKRGREVDQDCLVAQRIKRLPSIVEKLRRFPDMKLSQIQDFGGCRAILSTTKQVYDLTERYRKSDIKHKLIHIDDYIEKPRDSGYRGIHLVYSYYSDKNNTYNGLKIEIQIRSLNQHAWATAVETVGTFVKQALKSSQGEEDWLRFFALMGTAIAEIEKTSSVPNTPTDKKILITEIRDYVQKLDIIHRLETYGRTLQALETNEQDAQYFLLEMEPSNNKVSITGYKKSQLTEAEARYLQSESSANSANIESVLVSVDSVNALRRAYPTNS